MARWQYHFYSGALTFLKSHFIQETFATAHADVKSAKLLQGLILGYGGRGGCDSKCR